MMMTSSGPTLHDRLGLIALRFAKRRKPKYESERGAEFYQHFFSADHLTQYESDLRMVLRHGEIARILRGLPPNLRALDLGCGVGHILRILPLGFEVFGVDYSTESLLLARSHLPKETRLLNSSAYALPFQNRSFDLIVCLEVLEHLDDDDRAVEEIARILRPNGYLITSVPGSYYFPEYRELMGHFRHYNPDSFSSLLGRHHLRITEFLNNYRRFNFIYFYIYVVLEALNLIWNRVSGGSNNIYAHTLPFTSTRLYSGVLARILYPLRKIDEVSQSGQATTFVVAEHIPSTTASSS